MHDRLADHCFAAFLMLGERDDIANRLEGIARKAALLSLAATGLMDLRQHDEERPLRDAADQIGGEITVIAREIRK